MNVLSIDGNDGDGTTVTWETLLLSGYTGILRIEEKGNASFAITNAFASDSGTVRPVNGVLMAGSGARANILVKDPDGRVGFASQNAALEIVRNNKHCRTDRLQRNGNPITHVVSRNHPHYQPCSFPADVSRTSNDVTLDLAGYTSRRRQRRPTESRCLRRLRRMPCKEAVTVARFP